MRGGEREEGVRREEGKDYGEEESRYLSPPGRRDKKSGRFENHMSRPISNILILAYLRSINSNLII